MLLATLYTLYHIPWAHMYMYLASVAVIVWPQTLVIQAILKPVTVLILTMRMFPQIIKLTFFVKEPTKSTRAGRKFGGPVKTKHWGLKGKRKVNNIIKTYTREWISTHFCDWTIFQFHLKFLTWSSTVAREAE